MSQSEKVCKQLGIRPRYDCTNCADTDYCKDMSGTCTDARAATIYPDMTQPGNFVKFAEVFPSEIGEIIKDWSLRGMLEKRNLREYTIDRAVNALDDTAELDSDIKTNLDIIEWEY